MSSSIIPSQYAAGAAAAARAIEGMDDVILAAHVNLDGDALGSMAACGYILRALGRRFALYSSTGVPRNLDFLTLPCRAYTTLEALPFEPRNAIYLDCGDFNRLGPEIEALAAHVPSVNVDHHLGGSRIGTLANFVESSAAATALLVAYVAETLGQPLKGPLAECVALGIMTDTGGFCHGNTTADVFSICAALAANGCDFPAIREKLLHSWTIGRVRLWGRLFSRARVESHGRIAICMASLEDLREFHCAREDTEGFVEWMRRIKGTEVAALLREDEDDFYKFSLRSFGDVDVREVAAALGGGGHKNAAGGSLRMSGRDAEYTLLASISDYLNRREARRHKKI